MSYDLEIQKAIDQINEHAPKRVLLQLPDGLKPRAKGIIMAIEAKVDKDVELILWGGSCFGACDMPVHVKQLGFDMLIAWGHARWVN